MKPLSRLLVALCLCPLLAEAAPLHQITLPDGRQVQLNDDFTWEYLLVKPAATVAGQAVTASVAAPVLTEQAMAHPDLLSQATRDGITVKLDQGAPREERSDRGRSDRFEREGRNDRYDRPERKRFDRDDRSERYSRFDDDNRRRGPRR